MIELTHTDADHYSLKIDGVQQTNDLTMDEAIALIHSVDGEPKKKSHRWDKWSLLLGTIAIVALANNEIVSLIAMAVWLIPTALDFAAAALDADSKGNWCGK